MTGRIPPLDALAFPLSGSHLIEASAGTGKTYTIAALYVRLVLGHGGAGDGFTGRPLTPPEILVVTFTEAATEELRDRIRARLAEAARHFRAAPAAGAEHPPSDPFLDALRAAYPQGEWPGCAYRLQLASEWMDEAAVSTIHGWCNRMLREHAFDSLSLFDQVLETDETELLAEAVRDYWRRHYVALAADDLAPVLACWAHPGALGKAIGPLLRHADHLTAAAAPGQLVREARLRKADRLAELKFPWPEWADQIEALLDDGVATGQVDGRKIQPRYYRPWLAKIRTWAATPDQAALDLKTGWERLSPAGIAEAWKTGNPPGHPGFARLATLQEELSDLPEPRPALLAHAAREIAGGFAAAKRRRAQMGFDDLLTALDAALAGAHGERLAEVIRQQFPAALIDEFQDTDPVQYRIFDRVYTVAANRQDCTLTLIGDPKQAIYAFRGADIHTYLAAKAAVGDRLYTLDTNFRSTGAMVAATNHCFALAESREDGAGAFLFRSAAGNPVPFQPLGARGRMEAFLVENAPVAALTAAVAPATSDKGLAKGAYLQAMADLAATRIVAWLNRARQGAAGFAAPGKAFVPLRPGDIAVLVNNGKEAGKMRDALARRSVRSVYLSDRDSVFGSPQAVETLRWLRACAEPDDDRLLRAALSTATLDLDFAALAALGRDEDAWERRVVQFKAYRDIWQRQGVLPMLRRILLDFGCTRRLLENHVDLAGTGGERILTDLLHLAELLQQASRSLPGEHALIRWLAEQLAAPDGNDDERRMRLESDADLVQVITIHKAKGLEYPLVFLPFICATRVLGPKDVPLKWHDAAGELQLALEADPAVLARADHERLGEDIRKTYVAMTRARHATWIGLAPLAKEPGPGAIGHLFDLAGVEPADFAEAAARFAGGCADIAVEIAPEPTDERYTPARSTAQAGHARRPARTAADNWEISSYSALRTAGDDVPVAVATLPDDTPQSENLREALGELPPAPLAAMPPAEPIHRFPKGAEAGTFLHELLEAAAGFGFAAVQADPLPLRETIARRCAVRGWEAWIDPLAGWMAALLGTPLPIPLDGLVSGQPASFRLQDLNSCKVEMEFWFAAHTVALERLDAAVTRHTLGGRRRPALRPATLNGMLKGFMDLVFERGGRYYVADYKSNWLGSSSSDYTRERMDEAILAHRYDLQYAIYLFALHRLLRSRVPDYDYDRHVGGAAYLFLRGIHAPSAGLHFERPPPILMDELDEIFRGTPGGTA